MYPVFFSLSLSAPGVPPTPERGKCVLFPGVRPPACGDEPTTQDYRVARGGHRNVR